MQSNLRLVGEVLACILVGVVAWGQNAAPPTAPLAGTHWTLREIGGRSALGEGVNEPNIVLETEGKLSGSSGCNRLIGSYKLHKDSLRFKAVGLTKMACPEGLMKQEEALVEVLKQTRTYRLVGDTLELRDETDALAKFQARAEK